MLMAPSQLPAGHHLAILFDAKGDVIVEKDSPVVVAHSIVNGESKFSTLDGVDIPDVREAGYTLIPLEDIIKVVRKDNLIRYFQKA